MLALAGECVCRAALTQIFSGSYSQNFDSLPSSESTGNVWTDNSTITGWYANQSSYTVNHGNSTSVGLYDFGTSGAPDRALGSITGNGAATIYYGVALQNETGGTITVLQINYNGEQWRLGNGSVPDTLTFQYLIGDPSGDNIANGTWTTVSSLNFNSPQISNSGTSLDGNAVENSTTVSYAISGLNVASGEDVWFRWMDNDVGGNDAGLAIDDFSVTAVPEPVWGEFSGAGLLMLCGVRLWRQRRPCSGAIG